MSVDNAIVLATQTQVLPTKKLQEESLFYGLWEHISFAFSDWRWSLFNPFWEIKVIGAVYLIYLAVKYFCLELANKTLKDQLKKRKSKQSEIFLVDRFQIEMMDILFQWIQF